MSTQHVGIVVRKDGTVPFDADLDPAVKTHIIGHLIETGHTLEHAPDGSCVILTSGPLLPAKE